MTSPSPAHELVRLLGRSLAALGVAARPLDVERWALAVHSALASKARQFHSHEHVMELATGATPLEVIAAMYHDLVYVQVDGELPEGVADLLAPLLERADAGTFRIRGAALAHPATADVLRVFGRSVGDVLGPLSGLNELASAFVVALHLGDVLPHELVVELAALLEATIPFRVDPGGEIYPRLVALGLSPAGATRVAQAAVRFANRDVENFADADPGRFLTNTWKLLPETNPSLHVPSRYTVREYRTALLKMAAFLEQLPAERVFHAFADAPPRDELAALIGRARGNILMAVRYLRVKLYTIALIEAACQATGGDLPLQYIMGSLSGGPLGRLEDFLEARPAPTSSTSVLRRLLAEGRASASSFDIAPSPLATYLLDALGEDAIVARMPDAARFFRGDIGPVAFLALQDRALVRSLVRAAAELAETRREGMLSLLEALDTAPADEVAPANVWPFFEVPNAAEAGISGYADLTTVPTSTAKFRRSDILRHAEEALVTTPTGRASNRP